jgi:hypothetical protein
MELIEDANVPVVESDMLNTLQRQFEAKPVHIQHNLYESGAKWPTRTDVWCFHCAHPFATMPVPLVSRYDYERRQAVCFGNFCSPNCGRAYAQEHRPLSWSQAMIFYTKMLSECFGIPVDTPGRAAWPKERLKVFGGDLTIEEFRAGFATPLVLRVENVSFCIQNLSIVEVVADEGERDADESESPEDRTTKADNVERRRLRALASYMIENAHSKQQAAQTKPNGDHEEDDDEDVDEDREDHEDPEDHNNDEHSILASFLKNMRMYKGDEQVARSAMVDVHGSEIGAPVVAPTAKRQKSTTSCSASSSSNKK